MWCCSQRRRAIEEAPESGGNWRLRSGDSNSELLHHAHAAQAAAVGAGWPGPVT